MLATPKRLTPTFGPIAEVATAHQRLRDTLAAKKEVAHARAKRGAPRMPQSPTAIRTYRIYLRDPSNVVGRAHEVDATSDEAARERALMMLNEQTAYTYAEVWDRARLVCTVRRGE
jgi:hypothetical protein